LAPGKNIIVLSEPAALIMQKVLFLTAKQILFLLAPPVSDL